MPPTQSPQGAGSILAMLNIYPKILNENSPCLYSLNIRYNVTCNYCALTIVTVLPSLLRLTVTSVDSIAKLVEPKRDAPCLALNKKPRSSREERGFITYKALMGHPI